MDLNRKTFSDIVNSFSPVSANSLEEMVKLAGWKKIPKGDVFIMKGKPNKEEYFLFTGICKSFVINPEGEEVCLSFYTDNSVLTPHVVRTRDNISTHSYKALSDLNIAVINSEEFELLIRNNSEVENFGNSVLRWELFRKIDKEIELASVSAIDRLISLRKDFPNLENMIPHTDIASYLGITNISLSRLRKDLLQK